MDKETQKSLSHQFLTLQHLIKKKRAFDEQGLLYPRHKKTAMNIFTFIAIEEKGIDELREYKHDADGVRSLLNCAWILLMRKSQSHKPK
jgi:hypothetical protein